MMDCFSPNFSEFFLSENKKSKKCENSYFLLVGLTLSLSSRVLLSGVKIVVNIVCTLLFTGNYYWSIVPLASHCRFVMPCTFGDVINVI